jgi:integrase
MPKGKRPPNCYERSGSPYWWYRFKIRGTPYWGSTGFEESAEANEYTQALIAKLKNDTAPEKNAPIVAAITGNHYQLGRNECLWSEALLRFHDDMVDGTADERNSLRRATMLLEQIGDIPFHEVTHAKLFEYRLWRQKHTNRLDEQISPLTVNRDLAHCRQVFNHMADLAVRMPLEMPKWSRLIDNEAEMNAARTRHLSTEEEAELFDAIDEVSPDLAPFVEFLILSGQRKAAIMDLKFSDIDWQDQSFKVWLKGKGKKKRLHTVPLTPRMDAIVRAQPQSKHCNNVFTYVCERNRYKKDRSGYVHKRGDRYPLTPSGFNKRWQKVLRTADIEDFRVHDLRHTNATRVVKATGNIRAAMQVLGHRQLTTTARYANLDTTDARNALAEAERIAAENREALRRSKKPDLRIVA